MNALSYITIVEDVRHTKRVYKNNNLQFITTPVEEADVLHCLVSLAAGYQHPQQEPSFSERPISPLYEDEEAYSEEESAHDIQEVLSKLMDHHCAWPFRNPVDASSVYTASYYDIIRKPMDFITMQVTTVAHTFFPLGKFNSS